MFIVPEGRRDAVQRKARAGARPTRGWSRAKQSGSVPMEVAAALKAYAVMFALERERMARLFPVVPLLARDV